MIVEDEEVPAAIRHDFSTEVVDQRASRGWLSWSGLVLGWDGQHVASLASKEHFQTAAKEAVSMCILPAVGGLLEHERLWNSTAPEDGHKNIREFNYHGQPRTRLCRVSWQGGRVTLGQSTAASCIHIGPSDVVGRRCSLMVMYLSLVVDVESNLKGLSVLWSEALGVLRYQRHLARALALPYVPLLKKLQCSAQCRAVPMKTP